MEAEELTIRPVRPADRERVEELCRDIWDGHDYIPDVFEAWVSEPSASFQAAEVEGEVVGLQRLRPYASGLIWYEGLRVAAAQRRRGVGRRMLQAAIAEARQLRFEEVRLATLTANTDAIALFESEGFERQLRVRWWQAGRVEGGEVARHPDPKEADGILRLAQGTPGFDLYGGVLPDPDGVLDLTPEELVRQAELGKVRTAAGGRALAVMRDSWEQNLICCLIAGTGAALQDLAMALRFEADADARPQIYLLLPVEHPAAADLEAAGYQAGPGSFEFHRLRLQS